MDPRWRRPLGQRRVERVGLAFIPQYMMAGYYYDFYLPEYNLLIEADGDYWHANPNKYSTLNESQKANAKNDRFKNNLAKEKGYDLIRFWEEDIKKNCFEEVLIAKLKKHGKKN